MSRHEFSYREGDLLTFSVIYAAMAISVLVNPMYEADLVHTHLPVMLRLMLWMVPAIFALAGSLQDRWQTIAFGLLCIPPAERTASFFGAVAIYHNVDRAAGMVAYAGMLLFVFRMARRPEPVLPPLPPPLDELPVIDGEEEQ